MKKAVLLATLFTIIGAPICAAHAQGSLTTSNAVTINQPEMMAMVGADGEVFIDWTAVTKTAHGKGSNSDQPILIAAAKIMIAIRNGKWKPMPK